MVSNCCHIRNALITIASKLRQHDLELLQFYPADRQSKVLFESNTRTALFHERHFRLSPRLARNRDDSRILCQQQESTNSSERHDNLLAHLHKQSSKQHNSM